MKRLAVVLFALAVWLSLSALAQDTSSQSPSSDTSSSATQQQSPDTSSQQSQQQPDTSGSSTQSGGMGQSSTSSQQSTTAGSESSGAGMSASDKGAGKAKLRHLSGTIGQDGKTFTSDKDSKSWTIMNPDAVQGHEGHHVRLSAHVYPDKDQIHVMSVKMMGSKSSKKGASSDTSTGGQQPPQ
jgi:hypothetical protein